MEKEIVVSESGPNKCNNDAEECTEQLNSVCKQI